MGSSRANLAHSDAGPQNSIAILNFQNSLWWVLCRRESQMLKEHRKRSTWPASRECKLNTTETEPQVP